jgi:hypothetical protein
MSLVLNVEILGEFKNLSKATKGAGDSFSKLGGKFATIGKNIAKVTAGVGLGLAAAAASQIRPAIQAASDLSEATNAVNVAFGDVADGILELGENSARGLGLSSTELFGMATQFSSFAKTIAGEGGNVVGVVDDITTRGADFASVFNLDVGDALAKFQSGLAGQSEPLRMYGIDLSAAAVEAHALEKGIHDGDGAMSEAEKTMARYSLLMEETDLVTGDFAATADGLANSQRILEATIEEVRAEIGEAFLPILETLMAFILDEIIPAIQGFWEELTDPSGEAQSQIAAIGDAWEEFSSVFAVESASIKSNDVFKWMGDSMVSVIKMMTHMATFFAEISSGMEKMGRDGGDAALRREGLAQVLGAGGKAQAAANQVKFADERITPTSLNNQRRGFDTSIEININRARVDAQDLLDDINNTLRKNGSNVIIR